MYRIVKKFGPFAAAHYLEGVPEGHQCGRLHGHNYEVEVELESADVDETGFVVDYGNLQPLAEYLTARMDHRQLNEEFSFNPTAENLARHIFDWIADTTTWPVVAVRVSETPGKTMSEYRATVAAPKQEFVSVLNLTVNRLDAADYVFLNQLFRPNRRVNLNDL